MTLNALETKRFYRCWIYRHPTTKTFHYNLYYYPCVWCIDCHVIIHVCWDCYIEKSEKKIMSIDKDDDDKQTVTTITYIYDKIETLARMNCFNYIISKSRSYCTVQDQAKPNKCWYLRQNRI